MTDSRGSPEGSPGRWELVERLLTGCVQEQRGSLENFLSVHREPGRLESEWLGLLEELEGKARRAEQGPGCAL